MEWLARLLGRRRPSVRPINITVRPRREPPRFAMPPPSVTSSTTGASGPVVAFTPTRPKSGRRQLVGRETELAQIVQLLTDERTHVVLYAERGRGKTSLANMVTETLRRQGHIVARYSCEASSSFDSVIRGLARDLPVSLLANSMTDRSAGGCEPALPASPLRPADVRPR